RQHEEEKEEEEPVQGKLLQRQPEEEKEEEEPVQGKLLQRQPEAEKGEEAQPKSLQREAEEKEEEEPVQGKLLQRQPEEEKEEEAQPKFLQREAEEKEEEEPVRGKLLQRQPEEEKEEAQAKSLAQGKRDSAGGPSVSPSAESSIKNIQGGQALPDDTRSFMEPRFGYDFGNVRVHTDSRADSMASSINARAFTHKNNIVFKQGHYSPGSSDGKKLIAHELTHVVQQNPGIARKASPVSLSQTGHAPAVQGIWGWVKKTAKSAWKGVKKVGSAIARGIGNFLQKAKNFIAGKVRHIPGYSFIAALLGKDPISGAKVKSKGGFLRAVFSLIGKEKTYDQLMKANIVGKAVKLVKDSFKAANLTGSFIVGSIKKIWSVVSINPFTWSKAAGMFVSFLGSLAGRALKVGWQIMTRMPLLILEGFLILVGAPVKKIMGIINKGKNVVMKIATDPIGFIGNLFSALKKGFFQFKDNIWKHLKAGLMGWLMGAMEGAGIQLPEKWDLKGIIHLILQVLGLTYARIRQKVVKKLGPRGEQIVSYMETAVSFLKDLVTKGPIALWERIKEKAAEIRDAVIGAIRDWVITKIVMSAVTKLATMFNPVGAIIQAALAIYNTVMFFIERAKQIAAVVQAVFNSIAPIAYGKIGKAANWIEKTMARTIPVILGFLARLIGLGGISGKIKKVITKIRRPIDNALDKVIGWIVTKAKSLFGKVKKGVAAVKEGLFGSKKKFKAGNKPHSLWVEKKGKNAKVMVASHEGPLETLFLNEAPFNKINTLSARDKGKAEKLKSEIISMGRKTSVDAEKGSAEAVEKDEAKLLEKINTLAQLLMNDSGEAPKVGTYNALRGETGYNPHHVPPKGLMKWTNRVLHNIPDTVINQSAFEDWKKVREEAGAEMKTGGNLTAILIHNETHIRKSGDENIDQYRAHYGEKVREGIEQEMNDYIRKNKGKKIEQLEYEERVDLLKDMLEEEGKDTGRMSEDEINTLMNDSGMRKKMQARLDSAGGRASTQFYMTELDKFAEKNPGFKTRLENINKNLKSDVENDVRNVFGTANEQSLRAVKIAMKGKYEERKKKNLPAMDGTPEQQNVALSKLPPHGRMSWFKYIGKFAKF
ncbi:MAG: DUF4157 domain-containing protein, partial [Deltaproteobacteria bacterium]|nr:DUF4157 domain-containing protein [Deltaproteobacteria bacterium]